MRRKKEEEERFLRREEIEEEEREDDDKITATDRFYIREGIHVGSLSYWSVEKMCVGEFYCLKSS